MAIQSFSEKATEEFFFSGRVNRRLGWVGVRNIVRRKLDMLHYADRIADLKSPPGNKLEALKGNLRGYYSIRVNDQWRIVFRWSESGPALVRVTDYH